MKEYHPLRHDSASSGRLSWKSVFCSPIHVWQYCRRPLTVREQDTPAFCPSKVMFYHCLFAESEWRGSKPSPFISWTEFQPDIKPAYTWVSSLHLVCEPTHLMSVFLWELWLRNKQPVWCVRLIIPRLSWVEVLPVNTNKGHRNHNKWKSPTFSPNLWLQTFKPKKGRYSLNWLRMWWIM